MIEVGSKGTYQDMVDMRDRMLNQDIPPQSVLMDGFYYFVGPDGYMWQHDASATFPDITTWNVSMWCQEYLGDNPDMSDKEAYNIAMQNIVALAALNMKVDGRPN